MTALRFICRPRAGGRVADVAVRSVEQPGVLCGNLSLTPVEWETFKQAVRALPVSRATIIVEEPRDEVPS